MGFGEMGFLGNWEFAKWDLAKLDFGEMVHLRNGILRIGTHPSKISNNRSCNFYIRI